MNEEILNEIIDAGIASGAFLFLPLGQIPRSCCQQASTWVIDFDLTKDFVRRDLNLAHSPRSCDCLHINAPGERIDFIEMKSLQGLIDNLHHHPGENDQQRLEGQIQNFNFGGKIVDSLAILDEIAKPLHMVPNRRDAYMSITKNYILLFDIELNDNPALEFVFELEFAFNGERLLWIRNAIDGRISVVNNSLMHGFTEVRKMHCSKIDEYLNS